jgi:hypothetical protein
MPVLILGAFNLGLVALFASIVGFLGLTARRPKLEGEAYYREHVEGRVRHPARYAVTHPVEAVKRLFR